MKHKKSRWIILATAISILLVSACELKQDEEIDTGDIDGVTYSEGYTAYTADLNESMGALAAAISNDPNPIGLLNTGSKTYTVNGSNGGSASVVVSMTINILSGTISGSTNYAWDDYTGTNNVVINGTQTSTISTSDFLTFSGNSSGDIVFESMGGFGTVAYDLEIDSGTGDPTGTYVVNYDGETHTYDFETGTEI